MEARTRGFTRGKKRKAIHQNEHASRGDTYYVISAVPPMPPLVSCQFRNIAPITNVTLDVCNSDHSSDLSRAWKPSARKIIRVDTIPYVQVCSTSQGQSVVLWEANSRSTRKYRTFARGHKSGLSNKVVVARKAWAMELLRRRTEYRRIQDSAYHSAFYRVKRMVWSCASMQWRRLY